jgi:hypothetical protein
VYERVQKLRVGSGIGCLLRSSIVHIYTIDVGMDGMASTGMERPSTWIELKVHA